MTNWMECWETAEGLTLLIESYKTKIEDLERWITMPPLPLEPSVEDIKLMHEHKLVDQIDIPYIREDIWDAKEGLKMAEQKLAEMTSNK